MKIEKPPYELRIPINPPRERIPMLFNCRAVYKEPRTKVVNWQHYYESLPWDNDINDIVTHGRSYYTKLGQLKTSEFSTSTKDMLEQINLKNRYKQHYETNPKFNYFTYSKYCEDIIDKAKMPSDFISKPSNYISTMKNDYLPFEDLNSTLEVQIEKVPPNLYRRANCRGDENTPTKFTDDNTIHCIQRLQCLKRKLFRSYDFVKGKYTDETIPTFIDGGERHCRSELDIK